MDPHFLATEAQKLHGIFQNAFFVMLGAFLTLAAVMELLKMPLGDSPGIATLLGRALLASLLLIALPEVMNFVADATDSISREIGDLNSFHLVLSRLGEKLRDLSFSWTSLKDVVTILLSFLSFFGLYVTVYFAEAAFLFAWTLIYVFSPLVLALYVFPATAGATRALFRSILEVSLWKIAWACMAALLWSTALSEINKPEAHVNWLTSIVLNLMLMISVLLTPKIVRALFSGGIAEFAGSMGTAVQGAASLTPPAALAKAKDGLLFAPRQAASFARRQGGPAVSRLYQQAGRSFRQNPAARSNPPRHAPYRNYSPVTPQNYQEVRNEFFANQNKRGR
jgi:hypothetical protein